MKIFLAGTYSEAKNLESLSKSKYLLESFYYIQPWQTELAKQCEMFLLDSGAFTFMQNAKAAVDFDEYCDRYADYIRENDIKYFFELDIDVVVGYEKVLQIRKELERKTNKQCIPVWHKPRGKEAFLRMCDEYDYVAIGGIASGEITPQEYKFFPWLINEAHKRGTQIHGLGYTSMKNLTKHHFDSVDSTRWNCARFGRLEYFDGKQMRPIDRRKDGYKLKGRQDANVIKFTFEEWCKYQEYAEHAL